MNQVSKIKYDNKYMPLDIILYFKISSEFDKITDNYKFSLYMWNLTYYLHFVL